MKLGDNRQFLSLAIDKYARSLTLVSALAFALTLALLASPAAHAQTFSIIHSFLNSGGEGAYPYTGVTLRNGILYGTTSDGANGCGNVYQLAPSGSNWVFTPIYVFQGGQFESDGCAPWARPVFGPDGHLYGTTNVGSPTRGGEVFQLIPPLSATCKTVTCFWKLNILHTFGQENEGAGPAYGDLIWDQQGNIYGTTESGIGNVYGTVFELTNSNNAWTETDLYKFQQNDGYPYNGVIFDPNGNLYGTTSGTVYELTNPGWNKTIIHYLLGNDGTVSDGALVMDSSGNLYGTASTDGMGGGGTVFEMVPFGDAYNFYVLHSFTGSSPGPASTLTMDAAGNLYGTTYYGGVNDVGSVFKLTKNGDSWDFATLHDFAGGIHDGSSPISQVTIGPDGTLYGTTTHGGQGGWGTVWMIKF
jgi:uncharacterized repeat protein (TIGR03803 family)